jgi:transposase
MDYKYVIKHQFSTVDSLKPLGCVGVDLGVKTLATLSKISTFTKKY